MTAGGGSPDDVAVAPPVTASRWSLLTKVLAALGVLQAYNIVSRSQEIVSLSQSIQLIAAWWHYLSGWPFRFFRIPLDALTIDIWALLMLAIGAMSISYRERFGEHLLVGVFKDNVGSQRDTLENSFGAGTSLSDYPWHSVLITFTVIFLAAAAVARLAFALVPRFQTLFTAYFVVATVLSMLEKRIAERWPKLKVPIEVLTWPLSMVATLGVIALHSERSILRFCGGLATLLVLSAIFHQIFDPFILPWLEQLPRPPAG